MSKTPPTPDEIKAARNAAGLTQTAAAARVYVALRTWQQWEAEPGTAGHREMPPGLFELFLIKTKKKVSRKRDLSTPS